jgi:hypothetical protein
MFLCNVVIVAVVVFIIAIIIGDMELRIDSFMIGALAFSILFADSVTSTH